jgi:F0F1-type ATP synthase delta subunit
MKENHEIAKAVLQAQTDPNAADDLIAQYLPFIRTETAKFIKRIPQEGLDDELGIATAVVESARALKAEDIERIRLALVKKTGREIIMTTKINPELIAGIKVTVGNNVTDITMKTKIDSMKEALLKGGQA